MSMDDSGVDANNGGNSPNDAQRFYEYQYPTHSKHPQHGEQSPSAVQSANDDLLTAVLAVELKMEAGLWQLVLNSISRK